MEHMSMDELHEIADGLGTDDLILDVRSDEEFQEGHIKGARNVPHEEVGASADELKNLNKVYVHCKLGGRAKLAAETLTNAGLTNIICVSKDGMERWMKMGWPVE